MYKNDKSLCTSSRSPLVSNRMKSCSASLESRWSSEDFHYFETWLFTSSCVIRWYSTECSIKLGTRFWELWNIEFMQKKDVPFWDSLSVKGRVPIFGRSLFNHANRVGAGALVPPLLEMASFMLVDCGVIWVRFPALPPMILLEEKDRVRPRRRVLEHWAAVEAGRAFCVGCCETETDMWLMETQFAP